MENCIETVFENKELLLEKIDHSKVYCEWSYVLSNKTENKIIKIADYYHFWDLEPGDVINLFDEQGSAVLELLENGNFEYTTENIETMEFDRLIKLSKLLQTGDFWSGIWRVDYETSEGSRGMLVPISSCSKEDLIATLEDGCISFSGNLEDYVC